MRAAVEHSLVQLARKTIRLGVNDLRLVVAVLLAVEHVEAVERRAAAGAGERGVDVRPRERAAGAEREGDEVAVAPLARFGRAHVKGAPAFALHLVVAERGTVSDERLRYRVGEIHRIG